MAREDNRQARFSQGLGNGLPILDHVFGARVRLGLAGEVLQQPVVHHGDDLFVGGLGFGQPVGDPVQGFGREPAAGDRLARRVVFRIPAGIQGQEPQAGNRLGHVAEGCRIPGDGLSVPVIVVNLGEFRRRDGVYLDGGIPVVGMGMGVVDVVVARHDVDRDAGVFQGLDVICELPMARLCTVLCHVAGDQNEVEAGGVFDRIDRRGQNGFAFLQQLAVPGQVFLEGRAVVDEQVRIEIMGVGKDREPRFSRRAAVHVNDVGGLRRRQGPQMFGVGHEHFGVDESGVVPVAGGVRQHAVAVAARGDIAVGDDPVDGGFIQRDPGAVYHDLHRHDFLSLGPGHIDGVPGAGHVGPGPAAPFDPVFQGRLDLGAGQVQCHHGVAEGQKFVGRAHGQVALGDVDADPAGVLERHVGVEPHVVGFPEHALADDGGDEGAAGQVRAAGVLARFADVEEVFGYGCDHLGLQVVDALGVGGQGRQQVGVFRHDLDGGMGGDGGQYGVFGGRVHRDLVAVGVFPPEFVAHQQGGGAVKGDDPAVPVEPGLEAPHRFGPFPGMDNINGVPVRSLDFDGIVARRGFAEVFHVPEQGVGMAAHDDVDAFHGLGQGLVQFKAHVAQDDDFVDAPGFQVGDGVSRRGCLVEENDVVPGAGDVSGFRGDETDDPDFFAVQGLDGVGGDLAAQVRIGRCVDIGAQEGKIGAVDEPGQESGAPVELVVAHGHGVEADPVQQVKIGDAVVLGEIEGPLYRVPGVQHQGVGVGGPNCCGFGRQPRVPAHFQVGLDAVEIEAVLRGVEVGVGVVDVDYGEGEKSGRLGLFRHPCRGDCQINGDLEEGFGLLPDHRGQGLDPHDREGPRQPGFKGRNGGRPVM